MEKKRITITPEENLMNYYLSWQYSQCGSAELRLNLETGRVYTVGDFFDLPELPENVVDLDEEVLTCMYKGITLPHILEYARDIAIRKGYDAEIGDYEDPYAGLNAFKIHLLWGDELYLEDDCDLRDEKGEKPYCQECPHFEECELGEC